MAAVQLPMCASFNDPVVVVNPRARSGLVLVCEHASNTVPAAYQALGLTREQLQNHYAWDPGALEVARRLAEEIDAVLVHAAYSRLLFDVNRAIDAPDAIVTSGEGTPIPGNLEISVEERARREKCVYTPFHRTLDVLIEERLRERRPTAVVSIHSFTPSYHGVDRPWHVGVISHRDRRLADALLAFLRDDAQLCVGDNQPYAPDDGVYHTLGRHAEARELPCAMLEVRNDLIADPIGQSAWAHRLARGLRPAIELLFDSPAA